MTTIYINTDKAAEKFKMSIRSFRRKYIETNKLKPIGDNSKKGQRVFLVKDVENLLEKEKGVKDDKPI